MNRVRPVVDPLETISVYGILQTKIGNVTITDKETCKLAMKYLKILLSEMEVR